MRERITRGLRSPVFPTLLLLLSWLLMTLGVWGPWVWAEAAGLRILGLDFSEYVKFVAEVQSGQIALVREVFYLPLVVLSISLSLLAHRRELRVPVALRWLLNLLAVPVALAMLPPAWTPPLLTTPEFLKQTIAIVVCVIAALLSFPLLRRLPGLPVAVTVTVLPGLAAVLSISAFTRLRPALDAIYGHPIVVGPGVWQLAIGSVLLGISVLLLLLPKRSAPIAPPVPTPLQIRC